MFICNGSGWMTVEDFNSWFDHFVKFARPSTDHPLLLLLDGHASHTKNLAFIEKARKFSVTVMSLPPHCSHKLQPLDISFMGPLKTHFSKAIEAFLKGNPGKVVTINEISMLLGNAFMISATVSVASNGFRKAGIVPYNRFVFNDGDFAPADVTDVPVNVPKIADTQCCVDDPPFYGFADVDMVYPADFQKIDRNQAPALTGDPKHFDLQEVLADNYDAMERCSSADKKEQFKNAFSVSPEIILPLPKTQGRKHTTARPRQKQKATELTSNSYHGVLKASQASRDCLRRTPE